MLADRPEGGQKPLGMAGRLEALHRVLTFAGWLMRVFGPVVQIAALPMFNARQALSLRCSVTGKFVGDEYPRDIRAAFEELTEELLGRNFVPTALDENVQHVPVLINSPPQVMGLAIDREEHFIQVSLIAWAGTAPAQLVRVGLAEFAAPLPYRFVGHNHAPLGQQFFNITIAEVEAEVEPHRVGDDLLREAKAFVRWRSSGCCHATSIARLDLSAVT